MTLPALLWGAAWWTMSIALKGAVLLVVFLLAASALHRASAGLRHLVWGGGITAILLLPVIAITLPWRLSIPGVPHPAAAPAAYHGSAVPAPVERGTAGGVAGTADHRSGGAGPALAAGTLVPWLLVAWGVGAAFFLARLGLGALSLRSLVRRAVPLDSPDWKHPLIEGADRLGLERLPRLLASDRVAMPVLCGVLNPAIVVPAGAREWTDRRRRAVLCHEIAHLRRLDLPLNLLGRVACALHWFNPLVWHATRQLRAESERASDDLVLAVGTRPSEYADHLLQIVCGARRERAPAVAIPMAQRREFEGRMLAILERDVPRRAPSRLHAAGLAAASLLVLLPIAAIGPAAAAPGEPAVSGELKSASPPVVNALIEALEAAHPERREQAATALGTFRSPAAVGPLGAHLHTDGSPDVREAAAASLGRIRDRGAVDALSAAALGDASARVRAVAVWALGQIAEPAALPKLERALRDPDVEVRMLAAWAIGSIGPARATAPLLAAAGDDDPHVRESAAWALGWIRDPAAVPTLAAMLSDTTSKAGYEALWALAQIGGPAARPHLTDAFEPGSHVDPVLRAAIESALAGRSVARRPRPWTDPPSHSH